jgi:hypothetical protein
MDYDFQDMHETTEKGTEACTFHALKTVEKTSAPFIADISSHNTKQSNQSNPVSLIEDMRNNGIPYPQDNIGYDKFTRWGEVKNGLHKKPYWAKQFQGGVNYGDHREGISFVWFENSLSRSQRRKIGEK